MRPIYVIQRLSDSTFWAGDHLWFEDPMQARPFKSAKDAELAALRELPDPTPAYRVVPIEPKQAA
jgi:hypothetical protein